MNGNEPGNLIIKLTPSRKSLEELRPKRKFENLSLAEMERTQDPVYYMEDPVSKRTTIQMLETLAKPLSTGIAKIDLASNSIRNLAVGVLLEQLREQRALIHNNQSISQESRTAQLRRHDLYTTYVLKKASGELLEQEQIDYCDNYEQENAAFLFACKEQDLSEAPLFALAAENAVAETEEKVKIVSTNPEHHPIEKWLYAEGSVQSMSMHSISGWERKLGMALQTFMMGSGAGTAPLERVRSLIIALLGDFVDNMQIWQNPIAVYTTANIYHPNFTEGLGRLFKELFYHIKIENHEDMVADFLSHYADDLIVEAHEFVLRVIPCATWRAWRVKRVPGGVVFIGGEDYRIADWTRRMEIGEWKRD